MNINKYLEFDFFLIFKLFHDLFYRDFLLEIWKFLSQTRHDT